MENEGTEKRQSRTRDAVPTPSRSWESSAEPEGDTSALRQVVGLFLVPLLVVVACVAVFVGFGWIAYDRHSVRDYLNDLSDPSPIFSHRRKQAAYELSKILSADPEALSQEPGAEAELRRLFAESQDEWARRYLALVLGHVGDREALPLLIEALADPDSQTRIYSLWALGMIGDPRARDALLAALDDADSGIRKTAASALGDLQDPSVTASLERTLEDPVVDVRWNAALALARLGSDAGLEVLDSMLHRDLLLQVPEITPEQQDQAMISAIRALTDLQVGAVVPLLEELAREDPSLRVRQVAMEAKEALAP